MSCCSIQQATGFLLYNTMTQWSDYPGLKEILQQASEDSERRKEDERLAREQGWRDYFNLPDNAEIFEKIVLAQYLDKRLPAHYGYSLMGVVVTEEMALADCDTERRYYVDIQRDLNTGLSWALYVQIWRDHIGGGGAWITRTWLQLPNERQYEVLTTEGPNWEREKKNIQKARQVLVEMKKIAGAGAPEGGGRYTSKKDFVDKWGLAVRTANLSGYPTKPRARAAYYDLFHESISDRLLITYIHKYDFSEWADFVDFILAAAN